jgi:hypothetical protein
MKTRLTRGYHGPGVCQSASQNLRLFAVGFLVSFRASASDQLAVEKRQPFSHRALFTIRE